MTFAHPFLDGDALIEWLWIELKQQRTFGGKGFLLAGNAIAATLHEIGANQVSVQLRLPLRTVQETPQSA
jgi:hypothetical protein